MAVLNGVSGWRRLLIEVTLYTHWVLWRASHAAPAIARNASRCASKYLSAAPSSPPKSASMKALTTSTRLRSSAAWMRLRGLPRRV